MMTIDALHMTDADIRAASAAWRDGGTLALGAWLARYKPRFGVADYGALVALVRDELNDNQDYSQEAACTT